MVIDTVIQFVIVVESLLVLLFLFKAAHYLFEEPAESAYEYEQSVQSDDNSNSIVRENSISSATDNSIRVILPSQIVLDEKALADAIYSMLQRPQAPKEVKETKEVKEEEKQKRRSRRKREETSEELLEKGLVKEV